ncbi:MAG TPA: radical SAM protein, partial [Candidatus Hydrogenedentes bacterium]|nr:radical SAM protein [Candidatus Hydrogenedentota bacterium]
MLDQKLYRRPADTALSVQEENGAVRCLACAQRCLVRPGKRGICRVRYNEDGVLYAPFGYVTGMAPDPVEKKPFYHFLPGSVTLSFGMAGCNFHCPHCQNWQISQIGRTCEPGRMIPVVPEDLVTAARRVGARLVVSTYNEPLITAEWALAIFELARAEGLRCAMVSNGYASRESIARLSPVVDAYKI